MIIGVTFCSSATIEPRLKGLKVSNVAPSSYEHTGLTANIHDKTSVLNEQLQSQLS